MLREFAVGVMRYDIALRAGDINIAALDESRERKRRDRERETEREGGGWGTSE
jgi:hypothetical protein